MRLIVVALLGIEITIIALASTASAATHPDGQRAGSGPNEAGPDGWEDPLPQPLRAAMAETQSGASETRPLPAGPSAHENLMMDRDDLAALRNWPLEDLRWLMEGRQLPDTTRVESWTAQPRANLSPAEGRPQASKARKRTKAKKRHMRRHKAHKRGGVNLARAMPRRAAAQLTHATAAGWLKTSGLRTKSTGNCASKHLRHCTSFDSVRAGTIAGIIKLKRASGCPIMVTGGTETGHAPGQYSHGNGYKLDISHNSCIDRHIHTTSDRAGVRSDGARLYRDGSGTVYADEGDHWDILFR
ncbi:hypothetical protein FE391_37700 [Nonomuraea sp. KC401]|uniref:hypothetical protein n=1 Tax=unclassified Nonomuraea TaxID=2593643 RepID=UPI0010FDE148|nr:MULTISPECIES: hypothetical protein [unclassified Nonomuraea]NBE99257.1 hypothetical protein [Nonomuraea sp. K271]TLF57618.1 hypothetical protein FE391_37700 [Nonomuraea sp. KC401]